MPKSTFTSLPPEILQIIFHNLDQHDLTNCARVNRHCNALCEPLVWKAVNVDTPDKLQRFQQTEARQAFLRNVAQVGTLKLYYLDVFETILGARLVSDPRSPLCTNLLELEFSIQHILKCNRSVCSQFGQFAAMPFANAAIDSDIEENMMFLVRKNPMLQAVGIHVPMRSANLLSLVTEHLPNLCELVVSVYVGQNGAKFLLEHLPESIRTVSLHICQDGGTPVDPALAARLVSESQEPRSHLSLESLHFNGVLDGLEEYILLPFLYSCSSKLRLVQNYQAIQCFLNPAVHAALLQIGVTLTSLEIDDAPMGCYADDEKVAEIIRLSPSWKSIDLHQSYLVSVLSSSAIVDHCDHLQEIVLAGCCKITSMELLAILGAAKNLRVFRAIYDGEALDIVDPCLAATDIAAEPEWATRSLETFACRIEVPRPYCYLGIPAVDPSWQSPSAEYCVDVSQQVFQRLAQQTKLRFLRLGEATSSTEYGHRMNDYSLDMVLHSGMDKLTELKSLEELNVCWLNHRIGVDELDWMNASWPKLKRVTGLFNEGKGHNPANVAWIVQHRPQWVDSREYQLVTTNWEITHRPT